MKFRTEIEISRSGFTVSHQRRGFMAGSCFSENIGRRLVEARFPVVSNPAGILFNPASIARMLRRAASGREYAADELSCGGGLWFSYDHHGSFSRTTAAAALEAINSSFRCGAEALVAADYVILTFGTAWVYRLADGTPVANCHKQPAACFRRELLGVEDITADYGELLTSGALYGKQVLLTVSPVRHVKEGFEDNSLSKAILRVAAAELASRYPDVYYFPAFEILNDDLRDYRFYADDLVHPSGQAVEYIWDKFADFAMDSATRQLLPDLARLNSAMQHRILHGGSEGEAVFRSRSQALIDKLQRALPTVDFSAERTYFENI